MFGRIQSRPPQIPMVAIDRYGKMIEAGHLVQFHNGEDLVFEVVHVGPVLNPSIQGGQAIQVMFRAEFPVQFLPATPNRGMVIVGESQARIQARAWNNGQPAAGPVLVPGDEHHPPSGIVLTDMGDGGPGAEVAPRDLGDTSDPDEAFRDRESISGGELDAPERTPDSAQPCGCDAGAGWVCEQHRAEE